MTSRLFAWALLLGSSTAAFVGAVALNGVEKLRPFVLHASSPGGSLANWVFFLIVISIGLSVYVLRGAHGGGWSASPRMLMVVAFGALWSLLFGVAGLTLLGLVCGVVGIALLARRGGRTEARATGVDKPTKLKSDLDRAFVSLATAFFAEHPEVRHEWREAKGRLWGDRVDLVCGAGSPNEVYASLLDWQIAVGITDGTHGDFEDFGRGLSDAAVAAEAFERFAQLLRERGHLATD